MEFNLADLFESVVDAVADSTAMVSGERRLTYAELDDRANRLAHHLVDMGIKAGDRIGLQMANGTEYIETMLACFKMRAIPININYRYVASELSYLYADADLAGLVVHDRFADPARKALGQMAGPKLVLQVAEARNTSPEGEHRGEDYESVLAAARPGRDFEPRSGDDLYCVYTGGTTGMPKGVLWRQEDIFFAAMGGGDPTSLGQVIGTPEELAGRVLRPGIVALAVPPFMHASGHWLAFSNMFGGGTIVTLPKGNFDPIEVWRLAASERANVIVIVGDAMARPLLDVLAEDPARYDLSALMAVGSGGAVLSPSTKERLATLLPGRIVADLFGSSETGQVGGEQLKDDPYGTPRLRVNETTNVLDDALQPVEPGSGALGYLARTGHVPIGYLGDPEKTAATFVQAGGRRWSLPGDLATVDAEGVITVLGRGTLSINTGGEKVFPDEVEAVLKGHPDVLDAVVVGVPDERFGEQVRAVVQFRAGSTATLASLQEFCRASLSSYKIPRQVVEAEVIVRSPSGKADYPWAQAYALQSEPLPAEDRGTPT